MTAVTPSHDLLDRYHAVRTQDPKRYFRSVADDLGVSEAELLVAVHADHIVRLSLHDLSALVADLAALGPVRTMSRNDDAVIEQDGEYRNLQFSARGMGQTVGDLDLRIFGWRWAYAFAFTDETARGVRRSFQFFDASGTNIHKVFIDDVSAFARVTDRWRVGEGTPLLEGVVTMAPEVDRPDSAIDVPRLQQEWDALQDTHDFHALLLRLEVGRVQALRLTGVERAVRLSAAALRAVLDTAAASQERIMIFVGNRGLVQIFIGAINKVVETPGWLNVLDPGFNLHVREGAIDSAWVVRKPTVDGIVCSLECFDAQGRMIVQLFGKRHEGEASPAGWQRIIEQVEASCAL